MTAMLTVVIVGQADSTEDSDNFNRLSITLDDTSVAVLEKHRKPGDILGVSARLWISGRTDGQAEPDEKQKSTVSGLYADRHGAIQQAATLHFHEKVTADNSIHQGIHPMVALDSHQINLGKLVQKALKSLPEPSCFDDGSVDDKKTNLIYNDSRTSYTVKQKPDFISVTRGPGMRSSLSTGLDTAKGLAIAWQVPLLGVNHMQAHALTPRLFSALSNAEDVPTEPAFPFLSLLVSGGHTLLVRSTSLTSHSILATTADIAIGDCLDKCARLILPPEILAKTKDTMYGRLLETFAFPNGPPYDYNPPHRRAEELARKPTKWGWSFGAPLAETRSGSKSKSMEFSFTGTGSAVARIVESRSQEGGLSQEERRDLARETMRVVFEHLASRATMAFQDLQEPHRRAIDTLVLSGGVASNGFLRHVLRLFMEVRGLGHGNLIVPPAEFCTDNAAMIAWTGMEMFEAGWESEIGIQAVRKWSVDPSTKTDGGILGLDGWKRRDGTS